MPPPPQTAPRVVVIGGGPGGLMAAEVLASAGATVTVYEHMPSVGRKFLLAGRGGLNLTHSEPLGTFLTRYASTGGRAGSHATPPAVLVDAIEAFDPAALRRWCDGLGQESFVGSSGRVFPVGLRATGLMAAWIERLDGLGVEILVGHRWLGWDPADGASIISDAEGDSHLIDADLTVLAMGGASWPKVGSDGEWVAPLRIDGLRVEPLTAANVGFDVAWSPVFSTRFEGTPLKNVRLSAGGRSVRGEVMIVEHGIEGGGIYALGRELRDAHERDGGATLVLDLHPDLTNAQLLERLQRRRSKDSLSTTLQRTVGLTPAAVGLLREATGNTLPTSSDELAELIKATPLRLGAPQGLERAISTAGGLSMDEVDDRFMLRQRPGTFVAGEMLDWEAPTGGYLLQATFSTAVAAARGALEWWASQHPTTLE